MNLIIMAIFIILTPVVILILMFFVSLGFYLLKGYRFKKRKSKYEKPSFWKRILIDFPFQFWKDMFARDPEEFTETGLHLFCGEQGSGKTVSVVHLLMRLKRKFNDVIIRTNFSYMYQNDKVETWQELVKNENGIFGQIEVIDEMQTWFSSMNSKDFPPEMLTEISQQRKQRKMLVGTAQVFGRVGKPIREQTSYVYLPMTIMGCLTIVRISKPRYYDEEKQRFKKYIGHYFFVHNDEIRNAFDTYKKIDGMIKAGFTTRTDLK